MIDAVDMEVFLRVLQRVADDPSLIDAHERCKSLIAKIHVQGRKRLRRQHQQERRAEDIRLQADTEMVRHQQRYRHPLQAAELPGSVPLALVPASGFEDQEPRGARLNRASACYVCKRLYFQLHFFYHALCPRCAAENYAKRQQRADLRGRVALLTGGRIKIGYQLGLRLLRDGARVILTTRFGADCAARYSAEPDFSEWCDRLQIYALDLRSVAQVEAFATQLLAQEPALDIIINNAAQTIKRPLAFYQHLLDQEAATRSRLSAEASRVLVDCNGGRGVDLLELQERYRSRMIGVESTGEVAGSDDFPIGQYDIDGQQFDLRASNSWRKQLAEVDTLELIEVQLVNAIVPFILNSRLKPLLMRSKFERRFIVNVSAMEGQFNRETKTSRHPHTNMAKAALNMMTRTSAADYAECGIYMTSVDTGWITNENPFPVKTHMEATQNAYMPLDAMDGMARVYDPIARGLNEAAVPPFGVFLKDYAPFAW